MLGFNFEGFLELHVIVKITYKISFRNIFNQFYQTMLKLEKSFLHEIFDT